MTTYFTCKECRVKTFFDDDESNGVVEVGSDGLICEHCVGHIVFPPLVPMKIERSGDGWLVTPLVAAKRPGGGS